MHNSNENDQELQNDEKITAFCHGSNIALIKYQDDKDIPDSTEKLKKIYKEIAKKD